MKVTTGKKAGFCMGVRRAMEMMLDVLNNSEQAIYTFGPLIHNQQVIDALAARNVKVISLSDNVLDNGIVVIRAHGIPPEEYQELSGRGLKIVDATCPKVRAVQKIIEKHFKQGYQIAIIGDKGHAEVTGLCGYADNTAVVVESEEDIKIAQWNEKVCVVSQTTQAEDRVIQFADMIKNMVQECVFFNTVCKSTHDRQEEVIKLADAVDAMVVIGGKNSGNTIRLVELSREKNIPTYHVETAGELNLKELSSFSHVGVTAGASTPNWIILQVIETIDRIRKQKKGKMFYYTGVLSEFGIFASFFTAALVMCIQNLFFHVTKKELVFAVFFTVLADIFRKYWKKKLFSESMKGKSQLLFFWSVILGGMLYLAYIFPFKPVVLAAIVISFAVGTILYQIRLMRKFLYAGTVLFAVTSAILPFSGVFHRPDTAFAFLMVFCYYLLYYLLIESSSAEVDSILGIRSLAVFGSNGDGISFFLAAITVFAGIWAWYTSKTGAFVFLPGALVFLIIRSFMRKTRFLKPAIVELMAVIPAVIALTSSMI